MNEHLDSFAVDFHLAPVGHLHLVVFVVGCLLHLLQLQDLNLEIGHPFGVVLADVAVVERQNRMVVELVTWVVVALVNCEGKAY